MTTKAKCLDCHRDALWQGRCKYHYGRNRMLIRDADPTIPRCSKGCGRATVWNGMCRAHADDVSYRARKQLAPVKVRVVKLCACGGKYYAKGLCVSCYKKQERGTLNRIKPTACHCGLPIESRGLCFRHYWQARRAEANAAPCACGKPVKRDGKCGVCNQKLRHRCADTGQPHEWVTRFGEVYCRACRVKRA